MDNNHIIIGHNDHLFLDEITAEVRKRDYKITKQFTNGVKALRYILRERPEIAVLQSNFHDISVFEIIKEARARDINVKFIIIFPKTEHKEFLMASKLNIAGCIYAGDILKNLLICLSTVLEGEKFISKTPHFNKKEQHLVDSLHSLSSTEMKILALISIYQKSSKISDKLDVSIRTVEKHRSNIIKKLGINVKSSSLPNWASKNKDIIQSLALQNF